MARLISSHPPVFKEIMAGRGCLTTSLSNQVTQCFPAQRITFQGKEVPKTVHQYNRPAGLHNEISSYKLHPAMLWLRIPSINTDTNHQIYTFWAVQLLKMIRYTRIVKIGRIVNYRISPNSWDQLFPNTNPNSKYWKQWGLNPPPLPQKVWTWASTQKILLPQLRPELSWALTVQTTHISLFCDFLAANQTFL